MKKISLLFHTVAVIISVMQCFSAQSQVIWSVKRDSAISSASPRLIDLTGDKILDVVLSDGIEADTNGHISAFNGLDGSLLWSVNVKGDLYGSALFYDVSGEGVPDVFAGGRNRQFHAVNGKTGKKIWTFDITVSPPPSGWMQFYDAKLVPDQDKDGFEDIIIANGGDPSALPGDPNRPAGYILILSSKTGKILAQAKVPDNRETYSNLIVADIDNDKNTDIIFGTGGETLSGALWRTTVNDVMKGDITNAIALARGKARGYVPPPVLADINRDSTLDIIAMNDEGLLSVINGKNNQLIWEKHFKGTESYSAPAIGQFTGDENLDIYINTGFGAFPKYTKFYQVMLDGANGSIQYIDSAGFQMSSPLSCDFTGDGYEEGVLSYNEGPGGPMSIKYIDFYSSETVDLAKQEAVNFASTPWIGDIDANGFLDIVYVSYPSFAGREFNLTRIESTYKVPPFMAWSAYHGSNYNGIYSGNPPIPKPKEIPWFKQKPKNE